MISNNELIIIIILVIVIIVFYVLQRNQTTVLVTDSYNSSDMWTWNWPSYGWWPSYWWWPSYRGIYGSYSGHHSGHHSGPLSGHYKPLPHVLSTPNKPSYRTGANIVGSGTASHFSSGSRHR